MESTQSPKKLIRFYADEDKDLWKQLKNHGKALEQAGLLTLWDQDRIPPGADQAEVIDEQFATAGIILVLQSADFLANSQEIVQQALVQKEQRQMSVVPVILRPVNWQGASLGALQVLPRNQQPLTACSNRDAALEQIADDIRALLGSAALSPPGSQAFPPLPRLARAPVQSLHRLLLSVLLLLILMLLVGIGAVFTILRLFSAGPRLATTQGPGSLPTLALGSPAPIEAATASALPTATAGALVPAGPPTLSDPLQDNSRGYRGDEERFSYGTCEFVTGTYYLLTAPANQGIGCNTEAPQNIFGNLVFQITMTILTGMGTTRSGAGPSFHVGARGDAGYSLRFDAQENWHLWASSGVGNSSVLPGAQCSNPCPFFHRGLNQPNVFTIQVVGDHIDIQVNGDLIERCTDSSYASGFLGVELGPGVHSAAVAFNDLRIWRL